MKYAATAMFLLQQCSTTPVEAGSWKAPVEILMGEWCVHQFSEQLLPGGNGDAVPTRERHVYVEPFLGAWCLAQFPDVLSDMDGEKAVQALYRNHQPVEQQIFAWGAAAGPAGSKARLEPYLGEWCASQWPAAFEHGRVDVQEISSRPERVPVEPMLGDWCFASFPQGLASLDRAATIGEMYVTHKRIEEEMFAWYENEVSSVIVEPSLRVRSR